MDKKFLRSLIFRHLDGIVTAPVLSALAKKGVLQYIVENKKVTLQQLSNQFQTNEGYLNVALRVLASQNMLNYKLDSSNNQVAIEVNKYSERAFTNMDIYQDLFKFLKSDEVVNRKDFSDEFCKKWADLFDKYESYLLSSNTPEFLDKPLHFQICKHIEGTLVAPLIVRLGMSGLFHKYFMEASFSADEFHKNPQFFEKILTRLVKLGWFIKKCKNYQFSETGLFFARRAAAYGVTVSYLPMFSKIEDLLYGSASKIREIKDGEDEIHVDREMNVWGSGGAHATYFKVIDEFIIDIFNQPLDEQPKGILDMGCGNGALLQHLYEVVERYTLRGKHLDEYPLFLVGADYNQAALKVTRANLIKNDIWAKVIWGDIGNPKKLSNDLQDDYNISLNELLNIRTFLDHNRIWETVPTSDKISSSTGAYAFRGERLSNADVENNLKLHLEKWTPYVGQFGLLLIELHTLSPDLTAKNLGNTAATAYDATHGFSDQYILEVDVFHKICVEAGLKPDEKLFRKFPDNELATVSINYLKA
ncbi:class I SAM-dependent methyltransferase [Faecalibacter rhinopitheci]|uniref:Class I SAM-dependent methyltransferase n=1 Tax=Faecalibacter rhinopitheci TaxID=2779678 RepID=A0A8J7FPS7_9FLAO|nr:class I SAM-dependent methyltransferase [Faecalibacter rhinopitheci]MBF0597540.1 class I SAM-dependent methyltransferase [Faecalibacter rhinopitheci]